MKIQKNQRFLVSQKHKVSKNTTIFSLLALLFVGIVTAGMVNAYRGDSTIEGPNFNAEVHDQLENALENRDYDLWISIREENNFPMNGRMFEVVNEDNFDLFVDMHEAMEAGDIETANTIRAELGLGQGMMKRGQGNEFGQGMHGQGMKNQNKGQNNNGNFVDFDNDGNCDNMDLRMGRGRV